MTDFIIENYLWLKAFHLIAVFAWMAGLFYLPRLFVYHADAVLGSEFDEKLKIMERRLLNAIMTPAMVVAWVFAVMLVYYHIEAGSFKQGWLHLKIMMAVILTIMHKMCIYYRRKFANGTNEKSHRYYRFFNEIPTLCLIVIVISVVVKPF
ncbi:MAG: protoporphyrinogen oxidase HemJ [Pseudomonadota bacterium]